MYIYSGPRVINIPRHNEKWDDPVDHAPSDKSVCSSPDFSVEALAFLRIHTYYESDLALVIVFKRCKTNQTLTIAYS